jgi:hypothetical protein
MLLVKSPNYMELASGISPGVNAMDWVSVGSMIVLVSSNSC